jgi:hypothetical protein
VPRFGEPGEGPRDDLGHPVPVSRPVRRVVSLVPSLTESVAATRPRALVGATDWCTHPPGLDVPRVRGTKNPDLAAVAALRPQLVLANQEENRRLDVERLRAAGIPVWVTVIRTLDEAFASLRRMFTVALGWPEPAWLGEAERVWATPPAGPRLRAVIPVWRDPWMVVGSDTFTGDLAARLGLDNVYGADPGRYPHVTLDDLEARRPDIVVLPDEPYVFGPADGPEAFPARRVALVEGRSLTWYGPSLRTARSLLAGQLAAAVGGPRPPLRRLLPYSYSAELERYLRVRVECVGERDPVVAVRDIVLGHENRRQLFPAQHLLQFPQHAGVGQGQRVTPGGPQDVVGPPGDHRKVAQFRRHLLGPGVPEADAQVAGGCGIIGGVNVLLPPHVRDGFGCTHAFSSSSRPQGLPR